MKKNADSTTNPRVHTVMQCSRFPRKDGWETRGVDTSRVTSSIRVMLALGIHIHTHTHSELCGGWRNRYRIVRMVAIMTITNTYPCTTAVSTRERRRDSHGTCSTLDC